LKTCIQRATVFTLSPRPKLSIQIETVNDDMMDASDSIDNDVIDSLVLGLCFSPCGDRRI